MVRGMSLISPCFRDGSRIGVVQVVTYERGNLEEMESKKRKFRGKVSPSAQAQNWPAHALAEKTGIWLRNGPFDDSKSFS